MSKTNDDLKLDQVVVNPGYNLKAEMTAFSTMPKMRYERKKKSRMANQSLA